MRSLLADWKYNIIFKSWNENFMSAEDWAALNLEFSVIRELLIRLVYQKKMQIQTNIVCFQTNKYFQWFILVSSFLKISLQIIH